MNRATDRATTTASRDHHTPPGPAHQRAASAHRHRTASRASATTTALVGAYYLLPLSRLADLPLAVFLAAGLLAMTAMAAGQLRTIIKAQYPAVRVIQ